MDVNFFILESQVKTCKILQVIYILETKFV